MGLFIFKLYKEFVDLFGMDFIVFVFLELYLLFCNFIVWNCVELGVESWIIFLYLGGCLVLNIGEKGVSCKLGILLISFVKFIVLLFLDCMSLNGSFFR